jgi:hypothetical protein
MRGEGSTFGINQTDIRADVETKVACLRWSGRAEVCC